jgi:hypothetical protein
MQTGGYLAGFTNNTTLRYVMDKRVDDATLI